MNEKVLVVEDNPQNMRLIEMTLKAKGYTLVKATDGREALVVAILERPDLIIMDVQLPGMNGLEVTNHIRQTRGLEKVPIIALTAYAMKGDRENCLAAGCNAYLSKPISTRELPALVERMLHGSKGGTEDAENIGG